MPFHSLQPDAFRGLAPKSTRAFCPSGFRHFAVPQEASRVVPDSFATKQRSAAMQEHIFALCQLPLIPLIGTLYADSFYEEQKRQHAAFVRFSPFHR